MNKIIIYNKATTENVPAYFNSILEKIYNDDSISYVTFIQSDLHEQCKDPNQFINSYKEFITEWNLPFAFYPYYIYFNKTLPNICPNPNPKLKLVVKETGKQLNLVVSPAYGFLILDVKSLKSINFKFNEQLKELYYLQDLAQKCFDNKLTITNCCFFDRLNSWEDLKVMTTEGCYINSEDYKKEKELYEQTKFTYQSIQEVIDLFKGKYGK
jgi:hypothetical protein